MVFPGMQRSIFETTKVSKSKEDSKSEIPREREIEGYEMILGRSMDSKEARTQWIDTVEEVLEEESFERAQQHIRNNFDNPSVHNEKYQSAP